MVSLYIPRMVLFVLILLFSLIILGLSAHIYSFTASWVGLYDEFTALGIASAVLSLIAVGPMLAIDFFRAGAFTSTVWFELAILSFLWVLWLATAALAAGTATFLEVQSESQAVAGLSFVIWIFTLIYTITLLVFAIRAHQANHKAWTTSVRQGFETPAVYTGRNTAPEAAVAAAPTNVPTTYQYPPVQQGAQHGGIGHAQPQMMHTQAATNHASHHQSATQAATSHASYHQSAYGQV